MNRIKKIRPLLAILLASMVFIACENYNKGSKIKEPKHITSTLSAQKIDLSIKMMDTSLNLWNDEDYEESLELSKSAELLLAPYQKELTKKGSVRFIASTLCMAEYYERTGDTEMLDQTLYETWASLQKELYSSLVDAEECQDEKLSNIKDTTRLTSILYRTAYMFEMRGNRFYAKVLRGWAEALFQTILS